MNPGAARARINQPNIADAEIEIVVDAFLHLADAVFFGQDLDGDQARGSDNLLGWFASQHTNIRNSKASWRDLHSLLGVSEHA